MNYCSHSYGLVLAALAAFSLCGRAATFTNNTHISIGDTNFDGQEITIDNCTLTVDGPHGFTALRLLNGGLLTHSPGSDNWLELNILNDVEVESGGAIDVSGQGFVGGTGPGAGLTAPGAAPYAYFAGGGGGSRNSEFHALTAGG